MHLCLKVLLVFLASLGLTRNYGHQKFQQSHSLKLIDGIERAILEFDDKGLPFDPGGNEMISTLITDLRVKAEKQHTLIVVFVHGWHHNAKEGDDNLVSFTSRLKTLDNLVNDPKFLKVRRDLLRDAAIELGNSAAADYISSAPSEALKQHVIGIYVGWRGQSMPSILDYTTFWGRYAAAREIGAGGVFDLLLQIDRLYEDLNTEGHKPNRAEGPRLTNFVVVGHSFGGAVVLSAVEAQLRILLHNINNDLLAGKNNELPLDDCTTKGEVTLPRIRGLGDLVILVNPAVEALSYQRILEAAGKYKYSRCQTPILLTISADNDRARQFWFTGAQAVTRLFQASNVKGEGDLFRKALGEYEPQKTHRLEEPNGVTRLCKKGDGNSPLGGKSKLPLGGPARFPSLPIDKKESPTCFYPTSDTVDANSPFIVATASPDVINGHNGVFDPIIDGFLTEFVAAIEERREQLIPIEARRPAIPALGAAPPAPQPNAPAQP